MSRENERNVKVSNNLVFMTVIGSNEIVAEVTVNDWKCYGKVTVNNLRILEVNLKKRETA
jgi:hypothetical protein